MNDDSILRANILVVDDTIENLQLLSRMLQDRGYESRPVTSGRLALKAVEMDPPDLILLDINMPEMNGYEVCEKLKAKRESCDIPVIFISARDDAVDKVKSFEVGGVDYITKPFRLEEVVARVETHLMLFQLRRELETRNHDLAASLKRQKELERLKDNLVQMIVHDLKNTLSGIMTNSYFLLGISSDDDDWRDTASDIAESSQSMHRLVLNILDVMRWEEEGCFQPRRTSVNVTQLAEEAISMIRPVAKKTNHTLKMEIDRDIPEVQLDKDLMQRVMENLLDNSLKYAPRNTTVILRLLISSCNDLSIEVRDLGPGVPDEKRSEVFERYSRLSRDESKNVRESRGLGLAFCKLAVEAHGGRIWIEDNDPTGSVFCIQIPLVQKTVPMS